MLRDFLLLAVQSITHRKLRSALSVVGVFIGIMAVVALLTFSLGVEKAIDDQVSRMFGVDTFMLIHQDLMSPRNRNSTLKEFALNIEELRGIDGVKTVAAIRQRTGFLQGPPDASGQSQQGFLPVMGLTPEMSTEFKSFLGDITLEEGGRAIEPGDMLTALLGTGIAERLKAKVGDSILIAGDKSSEITVTVIGILTEQKKEEESGFGFSTGPSLDTIFIPYDSMGMLWPESNDVVFTLIRTQPGRDVDEVADRVESALKARGSKVSAMTYTDISKTIGMVTTVISGLFAGIAGISLLVGGIGVMNTMYTSVLERTKEIGVMKAVGAKNRHVLSVFLIESGLIGLTGGVVGTLFGIALGAVVTWIVRIVFKVDVPLVVSPVVIVATLTGAFALGSVAGWWPARRAARLPVVDALRYE